MSNVEVAPHLESEDLIRSRPRAHCYLCRSAGRLLYTGLTDRLFGASGSWSFRKCPAPNCGLVWLDPMPLEEDLWKAYRTYYTHSPDSGLVVSRIRRLYGRAQRSYLHRRYGYPWSPKNTWDYFLWFLAYFNPIRRESFDSSAYFLDYEHGGRLLELGCGSGSALNAMEDLGWQVEGLDFDPDAVALARKKNLVVHLGTLAEQRFPDDNFDAITASHFIEHVYDPLKVIAECRRILKPGGRLVQITPNVASWGHRLYKSHWRGLEVPRHLQIFTPAALANLCERAGFEVQICRSMVRVNSILRASSMLQRAGVAEDSWHSPSLRARIWDEVRGTIQSFALHLDPRIGEELVLIATK